MAAKFNPRRVGIASVLLSLAAACGPSSGAGTIDGVGGGSSTGDTSVTTPTVLSNTPAGGDTGVPVDGSVSATFSEAMDPSSLTASTFTLTSGAAVAIEGTVSYADSTVVFWPAAHLAINRSFTATITTEVKSATGVELAANYAWSFTTGGPLAPALPVELGAAGNFVILARSGIAAAATSAVTGDIGVSPAGAASITGFSLTADPTGVFSTSSQVTGKVYAADYAPPTPSSMTTAVEDMQRAFTDAAGRVPDLPESGAGIIGETVLGPAVYQWGGGLLIPTDVTLEGNATDVWIFQVGEDLTMNSATHIFLAGGALPKNVFWQVGGLVDLGTTAHCEGVVLARKSVTLGTGASIHGRLLAQTAVNVDGSMVIEPGP